MILNAAIKNPPLAARVLERKCELEDRLADVRPGPRRDAIATALASVYLLITGDIAHPSDVVSRALVGWLERNKHL
jgi:hypothetical protein